MADPVNKPKVQPYDGGVNLEELGRRFKGAMLPTMKGALAPAMNAGTPEEQAANFNEARGILEPLQQEIAITPDDQKLSVAEQRAELLQKRAEIEGRGMTTGERIALGVIGSLPAALAAASGQGNVADAGIAGSKMVGAAAAASQAAQQQDLANNEYRIGLLGKDQERLDKASEKEADRAFDYKKLKTTEEAANRRAANDALRYKEKMDFAKEKFNFTKGKSTETEMRYADSGSQMLEALDSIDAAEAKYGSIFAVGKNDPAYKGLLARVVGLSDSQLKGLVLDDAELASLGPYKDFIQARLRAVSGAAISAQEFKDDLTRYVPLADESVESQMRKKAMLRRRAKEVFELGGAASQKLLDLRNKGSSLVGAPPQMAAPSTQTPSNPSAPVSNRSPAELDALKASIRANKLKKVQ